MFTTRALSSSSFNIITKVITTIFLVLSLSIVTFAMIRNNDGEIAAVDDMAVQFPALLYKPTEMGVEFRGTASNVNRRNGLPPDNIKAS